MSIKIAKGNLLSMQFHMAVQKLTATALDNPKAAYWAKRLSQLISQHQEAAQKEVQENVLKVHAKPDDKGGFLPGQGGMPVAFLEGHEEAGKEALEKFHKDEVELAIEKFPANFFAPIKFSGQDLLALDAVVSEPESALENLAQLRG